VELADVQNSLGIDFGLASLLQDVFIAGTLTLLQQTQLDPPDERMKPENRFYSHLNCRHQVVPASNMAEFVVHDGFELLGTQPFDQSIWQKERRSKDSDDARFGGGCGRQDWNRKTRQMQIDRSGRTQGSPHAQPFPQPTGKNKCGAA